LGENEVQRGSDPYRRLPRAPPLDAVKALHRAAPR